MAQLEASSPPPNDGDELDRFIPPEIRAQLEERYWRPIERATVAESFLSDDGFFADPGSHPATFSDHGVVHVRDVARRAVQLVDQLDGGLLRSRPPARRRILEGSAVLMAYLHDIGMVAATPAGRRVHPQYAAQTALGDGFDDLADQLWSTDSAGLRSRIEAAGLATTAVPGDVVLREVLALSLCHSKSAVPAHLLDDPVSLRALMIKGSFTSLDRQADEPRDALRSSRFDGIDPAPFVARYHDVTSDAFGWLVDPRPTAREFVVDVIDSIRVLRAADALRQRGTTQRTSAGYEICVDRRTGRAVMAVRSSDRRFGAIVWLDTQYSIAEGNLRQVEMTAAGSLRVAFHRGDFTGDGSIDRVVTASVSTIADFEADVLGSFRPAPNAPRAERFVEVVPPPDNPEFATLVTEALEAHYPRLGGRTRLVDEPHPVPRREVAAWYRRGAAVGDDQHEIDRWFTQLGRHGLNIDTIDRRAALRDVRRSRLHAGEVVLSPGTAASVVVIPLESGARVDPVGGYRSEPLHPWIPIGVTGVVRGAERNAAVVAETEVDVLAIPAERYLSDWFRPYTADQLRTAWSQWLALGRG